MILKLLYNSCKDFHPPSPILSFQDAHGPQRNTSYTPDPKSLQSLPRMIPPVCEPFHNSSVWLLLENRSNHNNNHLPEQLQSAAQSPAVDKPSENIPDRHIPVRSDSPNRHRCSFLPFWTDAAPDAYRPLHPYRTDSDSLPRPSALPAQAALSSPALWIS